jgi:hypothetical protein
MSDNLPWEDEWGFTEWVEFHPSTTHRTWVTNRVFWCGIGNSANGDGRTRDEAARDSAMRWCREASYPLPFRPRPDLSTVEGCLRAVADAGGTVHLYAVEMGERGVSAWPCEGARRGDFGTVGVPWALADVQAAARYVLGIPEPGDE